jgi:asparagine synthase (glutamine-hydrolysing)
MTDPFFAVTRTSREHQIQGTPRYQLGHRLPSSHVGKSDGIFAEWLWDGTELVVKNDRYGLYLLYYFVTNNGITISSSIPQLVNLVAPIDLDETALTVFLRLSFFLGEDTPFRAIRVVRPKASFNWSNGKWQLGWTSEFGNLQRIARSRSRQLPSSR